MSDFDFKVDDYLTNKMRGLPAGKYHVKIVRAQIMPTKMNQQGLNNDENLYLEYVVEGSHEFGGEVVKEWICVNHHRETPQRIGRAKLAELAKVAGVSDLKWAVDLEGKRLMIETMLQDTPEYGAQVRIKKYMKSDLKIKIEDLPETDNLNDDVPF